MKLSSTIRTACIAFAALVVAGSAQARDSFSFSMGATDFGNGYSSFSGGVSYRDRGDRFDGRFRGGYRDPWRYERHHRGWDRGWDRSYYHRPYRPYPRGWGHSPYYYGPAGGFVALGLFPTYFSARFNDTWTGYHRNAYGRALAMPVGQSVMWNDGNATGSVTTTRDGYAGDRYCREFLQDVTIAGERQQAYGTACQQPDGSWEVVANQP